MREMKNMNLFDLLGETTVSAGSFSRVMTVKEVNSIDWNYIVGNEFQENGERNLKDRINVNSKEKAEELVKNGTRNCAYRFRKNKSLRVIKGEYVMDEEWYDTKTDSWIEGKG